MHVFTCQHGIEECVNNLFQACLFDKVIDTTLRVQLASCLMGSKDPHMKTKECMQKFNGKNTLLVIKKLLINIALCLAVTTLKDIIFNLYSE